MEPLVSYAAGDTHAGAHRGDARRPPQARTEAYLAKPNDSRSRVHLASGQPRTGIWWPRGLQVLL